MSHECKTHEEWLLSTHYMCPCGHVEWAHYGARTDKGRCGHCNCTRYAGETRPLTEHEKIEALPDTDMREIRGSRSHRENLAKEKGYDD